MFKSQRVTVGSGAYSFMRFVSVIISPRDTVQYVTRIFFQYVGLFFPGWSVVSLHGFDKSAEARWSGRSELLAPSPQLLPSGRKNTTHARFLEVIQQILKQKLKGIVHLKVQVLHFV